MKKVHVGLLGTSVCLMLACGNRTAADSSGADSTFQWEGNWIEVMPVNRQYVMGISFLADGKAQSIGSATLQYESWEVLGENDSLVLKGKSIGNGQTIDFSDTLEVVEATPERLVLGKGAANAVQYRVEYLKVEDVEAYRRKIEEEAISDGHDASNALDYQGTYRGTIPGADCPGIDVTLEVAEPEQLAAPQLSIASQDETSFVIEWSEVANAVSYAYTFNGGAETATDALSAEFTDLTAGDYTVKVKAVGDGTAYVDSDWASINVTIESGDEPDPDTDIAGQYAANVDGVDVVACLIGKRTGHASKERQH